MPDESKKQAPKKKAKASKEGGITTKAEIAAVKPRISRKPKPKDIALSARQYVRARKFRWERCAGFLHEMKQKHPGSKTRPEWDLLWDAYWARPVK